MTTTAVEPVRAVTPDAGRSTTEDRPRREDRAADFDAALAQAVENDRRQR